MCGQSYDFGVQSKMDEESEFTYCWTTRFLDHMLHGYVHMVLKQRQLPQFSWAGKRYAVCILAATAGLRDEQ